MPRITEGAVMQTWLPLMVVTQVVCIDALAPVPMNTAVAAMAVVTAVRKSRASM